MGRGGARIGAGRKSKPASEKKLYGNPGRREIKILDFHDAPDIPETPPEYFSDTAKEIYKNLLSWLKSIGCTKGILPYHVEEYAHCKARWIECEKKNNYGMVLKDGSPSPFVAYARQYLKDTNEVWSKIYAVVRETKLSNWDEYSPNDDVMSRLLRDGG
jgi:hypothetical protein